MQTTAPLVAWKEGLLLQVTGSAVEETLDEHAPHWEGFAYRKRRQQCLLLPHNSNKTRADENISNYWKNIASLEKPTQHACSNGTSTEQ